MRDLNKDCAFDHSEITRVTMHKHSPLTESYTISQWLKKVGDRVKKGDIIFTYESDKGVFDQNSPVDGQILEIFYQEGDEVPCHADICSIGPASPASHAAPTSRTGRRFGTSVPSAPNSGCKCDDQPPFIDRFIREVNLRCEQAINLQKSADATYKRESTEAEQQGKEKVTQLRSAYEAFCRENFTRHQDRFQEIYKLLAADYKKEADSLEINKKEFANRSMEECSATLKEISHLLNDCIEELNAVDFDALVPPVHVKIDSETFCTYIGEQENLQTYTHESAPDIKQNKTPVAEPATKAMTLCQRGMLCVTQMKNLYQAEANIAGYEPFIKEAVQKWCIDRKVQIQKECDTARFRLLDSADAKDWANTFFDELYSTAKNSVVDHLTGTKTCKEHISVGSVRVTVTEDFEHIRIINRSEALQNYITGGNFDMPVLLDLKKCGNILLQLHEREKYSDKVQEFIEAMILKFTLAFPAHRVSLRLIDTTRTVDFSSFNQLARVYPDILMDGIIQDSDKLRAAVKGMKEIMHNIINKKLSINGLTNIFEYNEKFKKDPLNFHFMVLTNFPKGIQEDIADDIAAIVEEGNKAGIFTLLVNNLAIEQEHHQKEAAFEKIVDNIKQNSMCLDYHSWGSFTLDDDKDTVITLDQKYSVALLPEMVAAAEKAQLKPILDTMFTDTDEAAQSSEGIAPAAEILDIPVGVRGNDVQSLKLRSNGGSPHAVVIGGSGSGKSNLLHSIILSTCYKYSPEEVQLYLVDMKDGNSFKWYSDLQHLLPHFKLLGITNSADEVLAILKNLEKIMHERNGIFNNIVDYVKAGNKMPRIFVIIDEIQALFTQSDKIQQEAVTVLENLFKMARSAGITLLWASQNIPNVPGLKDKVLSQVGTRISLKLNNLDDGVLLFNDYDRNWRNKIASLTERGYGVIADDTTGNICKDFLSVFAETENNRIKYIDIIKNKWAHIPSTGEETYIIGGGASASPMRKDSLFAQALAAERITPVPRNAYSIQFGQDYITGESFNINLPLQASKSNMVFMGTDMETTRDMMGYSLLSTVMEHLTNAAQISAPTKIYYANGEGTTTENSADLFNAIKKDFPHAVENVYATKVFTDTVTSLYKIYKERYEEAQLLDERKSYAPYFLFVHYLPHYLDLFDENPRLQLKEHSATPATDSTIGAGYASHLAALLPGSNSLGSTAGANTADYISFADAFKELMLRAGQYGIHLILSMDNPDTIRSIREALASATYKVFTKGINANTIGQLIGSYSNPSTNNPEIALVAIQEDISKVRMYRYNAEKDEKWYKALKEKYTELG